MKIMTLCDHVKRCSCYFHWWKGTWKNYTWWILVVKTTDFSGKKHGFWWYVFHKSNHARCGPWIVGTIHIIHVLDGTISHFCLVNFFHFTTSQVLMTLSHFTGCLWFAIGARDTSETTWVQVGGYQTQGRDWIGHSTGMTGYH